jgi:sugar phosphate isomerase/epimerase
MRIGCHAVLFKEQIVTDTQKIIESLKEAGAEGIELGARFFGVEKNEYLKAELEKQGMELAGLHVGATLLDFIDKPGKNEESLVAAAKFLSVMPNKNIIMTGGIGEQDRDKENNGDDRFLDPLFCKTLAQKIGAIALVLQTEYQVRLNYHNHNWEFKNKGLLFHSLLEFAPQLCFALDIGWAEVSGFSAYDLIKGNPNRFHYLHLRDVKQQDSQSSRSFKEIANSYVALGTGDLDYPTLLSLLNETMDDQDWLIVEYEHGEVDASRYTKAVDFIQKVRSEVARG